MDAVPDESPERHCVDRSVQLRQTVQHHALQPLHAVAQPARDVLRRNGEGSFKEQAVKSTAVKRGLTDREGWEFGLPTGAERTPQKTLVIRAPAATF